MERRHPREEQVQLLHFTERSGVSPSSYTWLLFHCRPTWTSSTTVTGWSDVNHAGSLSAQEASRQGHSGSSDSRQWKFPEFIHSSKRGRGRIQQQQQAPWIFMNRDQQLKCREQFLQEVSRIEKKLGLPCPKVLQNNSVLYSRASTGQLHTTHLISKDSLPE